MTVEDQQVWEQAEELEQLLPAMVASLFELNKDSELAELTVGQARVCARLLDGPRTVSCLSENLGITPSAMTQMADRLEREGLVERISDLDDRRCRQLRLTPLGVTSMNRRKSRRTASIHRALARIPSGRRAEIISALKELLEAAAADGNVLLG